MEINKVFDLIERNDLKSLRQLLDSGYDVNGSDRDGYSLLHMAVDFDNESVVRLLLSTEGIRVNCYTTVHRLSPIHFGAQDGKTHLVALLLDSGADINCVNHNNCSPLYFAVCANHMPTVQLLLERGADPNIIDSNGISPLLQAVSISKDLTSILLQRKAKMSDYCRELHTALLSNKVDISLAIIDSMSTPLTANRIGRSVLQNAVQHISCDDPKEAIDLIRKLIDLGEDINISNRFGTPLHILIQRNKFPNTNGADPTAEEMFKYLIGLENCDPNQFIETNSTGTPLTLAFKLNKYSFAEMLLRSGADLKSCRLNQFNYTKSADSVLKLLFYCGYPFDDSLLKQIQPSSDQQMESYRNFIDWVTIERTRIMSLKNLSRIFLRNYYQKNIHKFVHQINCPKSVKSFILFD